MAYAEDIPEQDEDESRPIDPVAFVQAVTQSDNLVPDLDENKAKEIGQQALSDYEADKDSMQDWLDRMQRGIDLAQLIKKDKDYPFKGASNVKYPLITSAALQFNARAYPAIVAPDRMVKVKTYGSDPNGKKASRADRVSTHMSWDVACNIHGWEESIDNLLVMLPVVGTMVRKVFWNPATGRKEVRLIEPGKFIVNDKVRGLESAPRCSEEIDLFPHEIRERVLSGQFVDPELPDDPDDKQEAECFIEQHTRIDLDDDEYPEPYIVTIHKETAKVVRIVADFEEADVQMVTEQRVTMQPVQGADPYTGQPVTMMQPTPVEVPVAIKSIRRGSYFIAYHFLPSLDGGFWGTGLGLLLGDISDTINTIINMMIDAGHFASLGGGFIGSDFRIKGGSQRFRPGEWKLANVQGSTIRDSIVPMSFPGPDATLFQMLGLLIEAGREIASVKDIMTGDAGTRQMTATTTMALIEQGMMVFTAAYKRVFRGLKVEFGMIAKINGDVVSAEEYNAFHDGPETYDPRADYSAADMDIVPVADPRSVTKMQEMAKAQLLMEMGQTGQVDPITAGQRVLEAASIEDREELMPKPNPLEEQMGQLQMASAEADVRMKMVEIDQKLAEIEKTFAEVEKTGAETMETMAGIDAEQAKVRLDAIKIMLEEQRGRLELAIGRGAGGMAGQSRSGDGIRGAPQGDGDGGGGLPSSMVGGPGDFGGGPLGAPAMPVSIRGLAGSERG